MQSTEQFAGNGVAQSKDLEAGTTGGFVQTTPPPGPLPGASFDLASSSGATNGDPQAVGVWASRIYSRHKRFFGHKTQHMFRPYNLTSTAFLQKLERLVGATEPCALQSLAFVKSCRDAWAKLRETIDCSEVWGTPRDLRALLDFELELTAVAIYVVLPTTLLSETGRMEWVPAQIGGEPGGPGVCLFYADDSGTWSPHWLPVRAKRARPSIPVRPRDRAACERLVGKAFVDKYLLWGIANPTPPPPKVLCSAEHTIPQAMEFGPTLPQNEGWHPPMAPTLVLPSPASLLGPPTTGAVGLELVLHDLMELQSADSPAKLQRVAVGVSVPPLPLLRFYRVPDPLAQRDQHADLLFYERAPDALDRGWFVFNREIYHGVAWELRPTVVKHMCVCAGDLFYVRLGQPTANEPRLLDTGDYNPDVVEGLQCQRLTYRLINRRVVTHNGQRYMLMDPLETASSWAGIVTKRVPFVLNRVVKVTMSRIDPTWPAVSKFPDRKAWMRSCFTLLASQVEPDMVGLVNDMRNQSLLALEEDRLPPGFSPIQCVSALLALKQAIAVSFATVGLGLSLA